MLGPCFEECALKIAIQVVVGFVCLFFKKTYLTEYHIVIIFLSTCVIFGVFWFFFEGFYLAKSDLTSGN